MADANHDDLADALARLAGGEIAPSEREHEPAPPPARPPAIAAKPAFRPTAPPAKASPPQPPRPIAPVARPATVAAPRAAAPTRPATPSATPAAPLARPQRPAAPTARPLAPSAPNLTPPPVAFTTDTDDAAVIDDDDSVIVPAPDASVFIPRRKPATSAEAKARVAHHKRVEFRRTLIPVLLTSGVLALLFGLLPLTLGPDSVAAALPGWVTPALLGVGAVLLALAVANMLSVRAMLVEGSAVGTE